MRTGPGVASASRVKRYETARYRTSFYAVVAHSHPMVPEVEYHRSKFNLFPTLNWPISDSDEGWPYRSRDVALWRLALRDRTVISLVLMHRRTFQI